MKTQTRMQSTTPQAESAPASRRPRRATARAASEYESRVRAVLAEMDASEREAALWLVSLFATSGHMAPDAARRWQQQSAAFCA